MGIRLGPARYCPISSAEPEFDELRESERVHPNRVALFVVSDVVLIRLPLAHPL
jgi:hypothetical protein